MASQSTSSDVSPSKRDAASATWHLARQMPSLATFLAARSWQRAIAGLDGTEPVSSPPSGSFAHAEAPSVRASSHGATELIDTPPPTLVQPAARGQRKISGQPAREPGLEAREDRAAVGLGLVHELVIVAR